MSCMLKNDRGEYRGQTADGMVIVVSEHAFFSELEELERKEIPYEQASRLLLDPAYWAARPEKCLSLSRKQGLLSKEEAKA